jgi:hypothetical protein
MIVDEKDFGWQHVVKVTLRADVMAGAGLWSRYPADAALSIPLSASNTSHVRISRSASQEAVQTDCVRAHRAHCKLVSPHREAQGLNDVMVHSDSDGACFVDVCVHRLAEPDRLPRRWQRWGGGPGIGVN